MRTLFISVLIILSGALFMSAGKENRPTPVSNPAFVNSVNRIASLHSTFNNMSEAQFKAEWKTISGSIGELKEKYPDLNNPSIANSRINYSIDNLLVRNKSIIHGDTCLRDFIKAVFACFSSCGGPRETVKACVAEACASYQACKAGGNR